METAVRARERHGPNNQRRSRRRAGLFAVVALFVLLLAGGATRAGAQSPQTYTLRNGDSGTTLHVAVGDTIELRLTPVEYVWNVDLDQSPTGTFFRPPLALVVGLQGLWVTRNPGTVVISATGNAACYPQCLPPTFFFTATVVVGGPPPPPGSSVTYQPGWNLAGVPQNTTLPVDVYSWDPLAGRYDRIAARTPLRAGRGYWAYFDQRTQIALLPDSTSSVTVNAPAGAWVMVGNPNSSLTARVSGADAVFTWDPAAGRYTAASTVAPGMGAWALSVRGGPITISTGP